jgi:hypothetical protein
MSVTRRSSEAQELIRLGQAALDALRCADAADIEALQLYVEAFERWIQGGQVGQPEKELGMRIADQHATIIAVVESEKGEVAAVLKDLREKGKGLRAYTDIFPKRISTMKPKKG